MNHVSIDFETYSSVDIKACGLYKYTRSPDFDILLCAYSINGQPVELLDLTNPIERGAFNTYFKQFLLSGDTIIHAYNAAFEYQCICQYFKLTEAEAESLLRRFRCTMVHGMYAGYTAGLDATGEAMGLPQDKKKLATGKALINIFCKPQKPTKSNGNRTRILPEHEPEKWELFKEYCKQDVVTEMEIERRLSAFPVPDSEQALWELDQRINARGVLIDKAFVDSAIYIDVGVRNELTKEAQEISGLDNPNSVQQLLDWLQSETGEDIDSLRKEDVKDLLQNAGSDVVRRMLELRLELSKASVKKYVAMIMSMCDDNRVRGTMQFYGASRTGRWAGRLIQVQNLPRNHITMLDQAREYVLHRKIDHLKYVFGSVSDTLSQLIRTAIIPAPGHVFLVADFSAIEARVVAWLAGEQWAIDAFNTHGKIYEATAAQMFGVPIEKIKKGNPEYELRQKGKIATLALGYGGGEGSLVAMGALKMGLTEDELPDIVRRWRQTNRRICDLWYSLEGAALDVVKNGGCASVRGLTLSKECDCPTGQEFLTIQLPSGRKLYYARPFIAPNRFGNEAVHYYGIGRNTHKWERIEIWGGTFTENVVQAIARDCLAYSMMQLETAGYRIVMHVHDEVIIEAPEGSSVDPVCEIMSRPIPWAPGLPLAAAGFETKYYKKD
jgi:DNA polymerase